MAESIGYNDMMRMQSEAVQRVREMQRRAQNAVQKANAQRVGRAQDKTESKGEAPRHSAPPLTHSARATALPLDYIPNRTSPRTDTTDAHHSAPSEETIGQAPEKREHEDEALQPPSDNLDRLLVVALILLLSQQEADELLLMALGYLII